MREAVTVAIAGTRDRATSACQRRRHDPRRQSRARHRIDLGHRPRHRPGAGGRGRQGDAQRLRRPGRDRGSARRASSGAPLHDGADLAKPAQIEAMIRRCAAELGAPDILVNNAGIQHVSPVESFPVDKWDAIIAINLSAVFHTTRLALPAMRRKRLGPDHQHRLGAQPRRQPQQVGLCRRQAWRRRLHQDGRARGGEATASPSTASRPAMSGRRWSRTRSPTR